MYFWWYLLDKASQKWQSSVTHVLSDPVILLGTCRKEVISNVENGSNTNTVLLIIVRNLKQPSFLMVGLGFLDKIIKAATGCLVRDRLCGGAAHISLLILSTVFEVGIMTSVSPPFESGN